MQIKTRGSVSHQLEWPPSPKQAVADVVRAWWRGWSFTHSWGRANGCSPSGNQSEGFSGKARKAPPFVPAVKLLGVCSKDSTTCRGYPRTFVCISALATIARKWKQPRRSSTDEWVIKNVMYSHNEASFGCEKAEIMTITGQWVNLNIMMLSTATQA